MIGAMEKQVFAELFDGAIAIRDAGDLEHALTAFLHLLSQVPADRRQWLAMVHNEIAVLYDRLGRPVEAESHLVMATELCPYSELASFNLFVVRSERQDRVAALLEAIRFLEISPAPKYEKLFETAGYGRDLVGEAAELLDDAKDIIRRRRNLC